MHVLLLAADAGLADELASAWRTGGAGDVVAAVLPARPLAPGEAPGAGGHANAGVFVPLSALGLSTAVRPPDPVERRLRALSAEADVVVVHLDVLDGEALHGGPLPMAAAVAGERALPLVVLAGRSEVSRREWSGAGVSGVHEVGTVDGSQDAGSRAARVTRAASTWAPRWS